MGKSQKNQKSGGGPKLSKKQQRTLEDLASAPVAGLHPEVYSKVYSATLFTSAALLFMIQPMVAKMMLPLLGGAPAVWTTCMLFFQAVLLGGYLYAHAIARLPVKTQIIIHLTLLAAGMIALPIRVSSLALLGSSSSPIAVVLLLLTLSVGLPFFVLSASAPLLQNWFSKTGHVNAKDPYFLYVASNIGSMLALLGYPLAVEPFLGLRTQGWIWSAGYIALVALFGACSYLLKRSASVTSAADEFMQKVQSKEKEVEAPKLKQKLHWVALAFVPSSLMLGVTTYFTTDIATIPLLWVIPLSLYLFSFILAFGKVPASVFVWAERALPVAVLGLLFFITTHGVGDIYFALFLHLATFSLVALTFHGRIAAQRPSAAHLTQFFLLMSFGGMLGGIFNGVIAPNIFSTSAEYPLALVVACLLMRRTPKGAQSPRNHVVSYSFDVAVPLIVGVIAGWLCLKWPLLSDGLARWGEIFSTEAITFHRALNFIIPVSLALVAFFFRRNVRFGLSVGAAVFVNLHMSVLNQDLIHQERSFFGILKVTGDANGVFRTLTNGTTLHGKQLLLPGLQREPLSYYHRLGPVGQIFEEFNQSKRERSYAAIGLGTGSLAAYGRPGQKVSIFEIDEAVKGIATKHFTYLKNCEADVNIIMGDARLKMNEARDGEFGLILVDAFSSDAIPVHLLTEEAVQMYFKKVGPQGMVAIHTSNRYLSLEPVLAKIAERMNLTIRVNHDSGNMEVAKLASTWVLLTRDVESLGTLATNPAWKEFGSRPWYPHWTDDFTSVLAIMR